MSENLKQILNEDDQYIVDSGYKPKLKRSVNFFASFAISFSFMSILMGVFTNYSFVLNTAGAFGLWTWVIVSIGQLLVSLVFAEMAGRIPLTGALYNWNNKLSHPWLAVTVHWLTVFAYAVGGAGITVAFMTPLQSFLGMSFDINTIRLIGVGIFLIQFLIGVWGVYLASYLNKLAVIAEIVAIFVFGFALIFAMILKGHANIGLLTSVPVSPTPYLPAFLMCTLLGAWTIFGFETPSDLSEETINAKQVTPKSIISSVLVTILLGLFFIVVITLAISDIGLITASVDPVSAIVLSHLGFVATEVFLFLVLIAMFASSLLCITLASRLLFAVSRDKHFVAHEKFSEISSRGVPFYSTLLIALVEVVIFLTMYSLYDLYASGVVLLFLAYLITVVNFALGIKKLPATNNFSLGRWHYPVVILAIIWLVGEILILTLPKEFHLSAKIAGGIFLFAIIQYPLQKLFAKK